MNEYDVIVVGGGVAGLIAGLRHASSGCRTVILESDTEPGGCVRLHTVGGLQLDRGAESFATARPAVAGLVAELGLAVQRPAGGPAWVHHAGGQAPIPAATLLGIPAHPTAADVRRVIGWAGAARAELDRVLPRRSLRRALSSGLPPSLGALVRRRMGRRVLTRLVQPVAGGVYSADPSELDIAAVAPDLAARLAAGRTLTGAVAAIRGRGPAAGSAVGGIVGGMGLLSGALAERFLAAGGTLRCGTRAQSLLRTDGGWRVTAISGEDTVTVSGDGDDEGTGGAAGGFAAPRATGGETAGALRRTAEEFTAAAVVLAVPGAVAAPLIAGATGGAAELPVAPASRVRLVTLVLDAPELDAAPRGSGLLVAPGVTDVAAKALTHATAKWQWLADRAGPHRHVLRLSYGRGATSAPGGTDDAAAGSDVARDPDAAAGPDAAADTDRAVVDLALRDASRMLGVPLTRRDLSAHAIVDFSGQLAAGRAAQAADRARFQRQIAAVDGLSVVGSAVAGTGLSAVVANATGAPLVGPGRKRAGSKHDES